MSVVVTHHERPGLLGGTVESLAALDYPADRFEVVLFDDGSRSPAALEALAALEAGEFAPRGWRVLRGSENCGVGCARNRGAAASRGDYLVFLDSDDVAAFDDGSVHVRELLDRLEAASPRVIVLVTQQRVQRAICAQCPA